MPFCAVLQPDSESGGSWEPVWAAVLGSDRHDHVSAQHRDPFSAFRSRGAGCVVFSAGRSLTKRIATQSLGNIWQSIFQQKILARAQQVVSAALDFHDFQTAQVQPWLDRLRAQPKPETDRGTQG